jgi:hypothetical protein
MAGNSRTTFAKRQKERARAKRSRQKGATAAERKLQQTEEDDTFASRPPGGSVIAYDDGDPKSLNCVYF